MRAAAEHGKPLFVEKPLCYTEEEVEPMLRLVRESGIPFMVGFNRPYSPIMQAVKPIFRGARKGNTLIIYRIIGEAQLWPAGHKNAIIERGESTIVHEATHIFDLLDWLTDAYPTRVFTTGGGNMDNIITLDYPDDTWAVVISGDNSCSGFPKERLEINTNHSTIVAEGFSDLTAMGVDEQLVRRHFGLEGELTEGWPTYEERLQRGWDFRRAITPEQKAYGYYYPKGPGRRSVKGHYEELEHFRKSIRAGTPPETGVERGAMAEMIAWRAVESVESGRPVALDFSALK
jgi:predicted dehydrogenase